MTVDKKIIAVHTLPSTSPEKVQRFFDDGRLIRDLGNEGHDVIMTNRHTFETGEAQRATVRKRGEIALRSILVDPSEVGAMHVRIVPQITKSGSELIPKLNDNSLKELAGSKIELYRQVLSGYQPETSFLSMKPDDFTHMAELIDSIDTPDVVIKDNAGFGGYSAKILSKPEALSWVARQLEAGKTNAQILQPKVAFGALPKGIKATSSKDHEILIRRARKEGFLTELRYFAIQSGDRIQTTPVLRLVPDATLPMQGDNDIYIEVDVPDELDSLLQETTRDIVTRATEKAGGIAHAVGAVDYYFDTQGVPHVMEANFRSPALPETSKYPVAGEVMRQSLVAALTTMSQDDRNK